MIWNGRIASGGGATISIQNYRGGKNDDTNECGKPFSKSKKMEVMKEFNQHILILRFSTKIIFKVK